MNHTTGYKVHYQYSIDAGGSLDITTSVSPRGYQPRWLPKIGLQMTLPGEYRYIGWFGRGPYENYPDRKTGAAVGYYGSSVEEEYVPYIIPQDYGNKCDVRFLEIMDEEGTGMRIAGTELFNMSVQKYATDHLDRATHRFQLKEEDRVTLNLDHRVSGVGCTAISVLNPYRVKPEETTFSFRITPMVHPEIPRWTHSNK
jgi:beta-galactosidase